MGASHKGMGSFFIRGVNPSKCQVKFLIGGGISWIKRLKTGIGKCFIFHTITPALCPFLYFIG